MMYNTVSAKVLEQLGRICGSHQVITSRDQLIPYSHDEFALEDIRHFPDVVVRPGSTAEISEIVKLGNLENLPLTTRGGDNSLCGGCVPVFGGKDAPFRCVTPQETYQHHQILTAALESGKTGKKRNGKLKNKEKDEWLSQR